MSVEELKEEALRLNPEARAYLAHELLASLDAMSEAEIEKLWIDEASWVKCLFYLICAIINNKSKFCTEVRV